MKVCPLNPAHGKFTNKGVESHLAKVHGVILKRCPVPGCDAKVPNLRAHAEDCHPEWRLHTGKFVWEVLEEEDEEDTCPILVRPRQRKEPVGEHQ